MRLSTIAIDSQGLAPPQWSAAWVQRRLIEAYSVERRLPHARRRLLIASAWPPMATEFSDIVGSSMEAIARDAAVLLSIAIQHHVPLDILRHAITREQDGSASSIIGKVVDELSGRAVSANQQEHLLNELR